MPDAIWSGRADGVDVARLPAQPLHVLRLRAPTPEAIAHVAALLGTPLPTTPNSVRQGQARALWLAPGEWLVVGSQASGADVTSAAETRAAHWADISDGRAVYEISGPRARDLLAKGSTIDFHPRAFARDACAQSAFAQLFSIVERTGKDSFRLYVDVSLAHHMELWLGDALEEFQIRNPD
ncbi:sarcosine oxidase subunit gamma [Sphingobium sp.]|uniref:sarcosine oxidase subunit gamma n=1 Tax=Sphingobium sp. TaxID=1912891 RepID=UPI0028BF5139|nr:sarcosine oxidase subunit gamma family protein [Sphingobium sp.]